MTSRLCSLPICGALAEMMAFLLGPDGLQGAVMTANFYPSLSCTVRPSSSHTPQTYSQVSPFWMEPSLLHSGRSCFRATSTTSALTVPWVNHQVIPGLLFFLHHPAVLHSNTNHGLLGVFLPPLQYSAYSGLALQPVLGQTHSVPGWCIPLPAKNLCVLES